MGRTSMDSIVSPASADLQMPSLMDWDQENTLYGSVNVSLRESQHYCFALLLFLAKFRYCIHMSLPGFFWCCGLWEEDIQLLMLGFAEVLTLNKSPPSTIRAGVQGSHWHVPAVHEENVLFSSPITFSSWLPPRELPYRLQTHMR